jgi:hypothetical protein
LKIIENRLRRTLKRDWNPAKERKEPQRKQLEIARFSVISHPASPSLREPRLSFSGIADVSGVTGISGDVWGSNAR